MPDEEKKTILDKLTQIVYDTVSILATAVIAIMFIFTFAVRIAGVVGPSMIPTLHNGDKLLVSAFLFEPEAGDIVIITQPNWFHEPIVKRIIALPGQEVDIDFTYGRVFVDGELLNEPYVRGSTVDKFDVDFPLIVPEGKVFVMGDNRRHSTDSRSSQIGFVDENYLLGKVLLRISPFGEWRVE